MYFQKLIVALTLFVLATGCTKELSVTNQKEELITMENLAVPAGFQWNTTTSTVLSVAVAENVYNSNQQSTIKVFNGNPYDNGVLLAKGSASAGQPFIAKINVLTGLQELYVMETTPGNNSIIKKVAVTGSNSLVTMADNSSLSLNQPSQFGSVVNGPDCTTGCTNSISLTNNNQWITVEKGNTVCVSGTDKTVNITFGNGGGKLRLCGQNLTIGNVNENNGSTPITIEITEDATVQFSNLNFNNSGNQLLVYGSATFTNNLAIPGQLTNYGSITINGNYDLNTGNNPLTNHTNYGTILVKKDMNINAKVTFTNEGTLTVQDNLKINGNGTLVNKCKLWVKTNFIANALVKNYSFIKTDNETTLNGNAEIQFFAGAMLTTKNMILNGTVSGSGSTSLIKVSAKTTINGGGKVLGALQYCDANGIETNNGTIGNGAVLGCNVYIPTSDCNTEGNGTPICIDSDKDGVCDKDDNYPSDASLAYDNKIAPASVAFEDNWPWQGDYDINDLVMNFEYNIITNAANKVAKVVAIYQLRATGGANQNGFGVEFPVESNKISNVIGAQLEAGQTKAVITLFDNMRAAMSGWNTWPNQAALNPTTYNVSFEVNNGPLLSAFGLGYYNPFIWNNGRGRGFETHLPGKMPTSLANTAIFNTGLDATNVSTGDTYITKNTRYPWAIYIPASFDYPIEKGDINLGYINFKHWIISGGTTNTDWYLNQPGYRNNAYLFKK